MTPFALPTPAGDSSIIGNYLAKETISHRDFNHVKLPCHSHTFDAAPSAWQAERWQPRCTFHPFPRFFSPQGGGGLSQDSNFFPFSTSHPRAPSPNMRLCAYLQSLRASC